MKDCLKQLFDFWSFRQEISEEDGLPYKNQRLIVPHSEWLETLKVSHLEHYAVDKMQLRALETSIVTFEFEFNSTVILRVTPRLTTLLL